MNNMKVLNKYNTHRINNNLANPAFKSKKKIIQTGINESVKIASAAITSTALAGIALQSKENKKEDFYPKIKELPKLSAEDFRIKKLELAKIDKPITTFCDKSNIFLLEKLFKHKEFYGNKSLAEELWQIMGCSRHLSDDDIVAKINVLNSILSSKSILDSKLVKENLGLLVKYTDDINKNLTQKILSDKKLYENTSISENIKIILAVHTSIEEANNKITLLDKYLKSPELYNNKKVQEKIGNIVSALDYYNYKVKIADYILSDERLFKNENIMNITDEIIYSSDKLYSFEKVLKPFFANDEWINNKNLVDGIASYSCMLSEIGNINIVEFFDYAKRINKENLKKIAPKLDIYSPLSFSTFVANHYKIGTTDFNEQTLTLPIDLTKLLSENHYGNSLYNLLTTFPNTNLNLGKAPQEWLDKVDDKEKAEKELRELFENFVIYAKTQIKNMNRGWDDFSTFNQLFEKTLKKPVNIEYMAHGIYAYAYKISVEGASPKVLKVFHPQNQKEEHNGPWAEIPKAFFLNQFPEKFVHTYMGKLPPVTSRISDNEYLLTEFLESKSRAKKKVSKNLIKNKYIITCEDISHNHNTIDGIVYDHGSIVVKPRLKDACKPFNIVEVVKNLKKD